MTDLQTEQPIDARTTQRDLRKALARLAAVLNLAVVEQDLDADLRHVVPAARWLPGPRPHFDRPALGLDRNTHGWAVGLVGPDGSTMDLTVVTPQYLPVGELYRMLHAAARVVEKFQGHAQATPLVAPSTPPPEQAEHVLVSVPRHLVQQAFAASEPPPQLPVTRQSSAPPLLAYLEEAPKGRRASGRFRAIVKKASNL